MFGTNHSSSSSPPGGDVDIAIRVERVRERLEQLINEKAQLQVSQLALSEEAAQLESKEQQMYQQLRQRYTESLQLVFDCVQRSKNENEIRNATNLMREFATKEKMFLLSCERELDALRTGIANEISRLQEESAAAVAEASEFKSERNIWDNEAKAQRQEILRLQQERLELESKLDATLLRHARDLFEVGTSRGTGVS